MVAAQDVLHFWLGEVRERSWFAEDEELDQTIRDRFQPAWEAAMNGRLEAWRDTARGALAHVILLDQFPRNMFRNTRRAFASDHRARAAAEAAITRHWDLNVSERERMFFYLPLGHSENLADQDRAVYLVGERMPDLGGAYLVHVRAHREMIRRFGRFPMRNEVLGRPNTPKEEAFLANGGYVALVEQLMK